MQDEHGCSRRPWAQTAALYFCFFISGAAGLIYEVIWSKYLALCLGSTGVAQVIVLATFMGGMAFGSHFLGRAADRFSSPLRLYFLLEVGIGVYGLLFERVFMFARHLFVAAAAASNQSPAIMTGGKVAAAVLTILLPSFLMGGTLPAISRHMIRRMADVGPRISLLYFLNSIGAVAGCLLAGFHLIRYYGLQFSLVTGALFSILAGLIAFLLIPRGPRGAAEPASGEVGMEAAEPLPGGRWAAWFLLACVSVSGAVSMMYEVAWIRLLTLVLGSSTYSFSVMLATFIFGLSIGGLLLSLRRKTTGYTMIFALSEAGVGLAVLLMLPLYVRLPYLFNQLASSLSREAATFGLYELCKFLLCGAVMIIPTVLQGITLPAAAKVLTRSVKSLGSRIGLIFAVNTFGTLFGVVYAGFLGLPHFGIKGTLEIAAAINCVMAIGIFAIPASPGRALRVAGAAAVILAVWGWYAANMGSWDRDVLSIGTYRSRVRLPSFQTLLAQARERTTVFYRDGVGATVAVQDQGVGTPEQDRLLVINGKPDASTRSDLVTQKMLGHLPMLIGDKTANVLIVGIGSGTTIGSVLAYPVQHVDVVEISREVVDASRLFDSVNGRYWEDPRVSVHCEDAKTFLQVANRQYDVIISEATNPWIAGVAGVFSKEFFEECRRRLAPGGLFVQWVQFYELEDATFYMILETFTGLFPCYTLWNPESWDTILVGATTPFAPDFARMAERLGRPAVLANMQPLGIKSPLPVLTMQMCDHSGDASVTRWLGAVHSDYFPALEYVAPRGFFMGSLANGARWLDQRAESPANAKLWLKSYLAAHPPGREECRDSYAFAARYQSLFDGLAAASAREWLARCPDDPEARFAAAARSLPGHGDAAAALWPAGGIAGPLDYDAALLSCRYRYNDYLPKRSCLGAPDSSALLRDIGSLLVLPDHPANASLLFWDGVLRYDRGEYAEAESSLRRALILGRQTASDIQLAAGLLLCRTLLAQHRPEEAHSVAADLVKAFPSNLHLMLLRSEAQAAIGNAGDGSGQAAPPK